MRLTCSLPITRGMDRTDLTLIRLLLRDSRTSFRDLADTLDLAVPSVHARIQGLVKSGVSGAFTARLSLAQLAAPSVFISGGTQTPHPTDLLERLGTEEHTYWVAIAGGNFVYVGGYLRDYDELDAYTARISREAEMPQPTVALVPALPLPPGPKGPSRLDRMDYQILRALACSPSESS